MMPKCQGQKGIRKSNSVWETQGGYGQEGISEMSPKDKFSMYHKAGGGVWNNGPLKLSMPKGLEPRVCYLTGQEGLCRCD